MEVGRGGRGIKEVGQSNIYPSALIRRMGGTEGEGEREREKRESNENESRKVQFVVALICHCISPPLSPSSLPHYFSSFLLLPLSLSLYIYTIFLPLLPLSFSPFAFESRVLFLPSTCTHSRTRMILPLLFLPLSPRSSFFRPLPRFSSPRACIYI